MTVLDGIEVDVSHNLPCGQINMHTRALQRVGLARPARSPPVFRAGPGGLKKKISGLGSGRSTVAGLWVGRCTFFENYRALYILCMCKSA